MMKNYIKCIYTVFYSVFIFSCSPEDVTNNTEIDSGAIEETEVPEIIPNVAISPKDIIDLSTWNISIPILESNGTSIDISTTELLNGYMDEDYFFINEDENAIVFKNFIEGPKTSVNTKFTRSELREMNYGTLFDTQNGLSTKDLANNWVFSSSSASVQSQAAAVDGELTATLAINQVTTTGDNSQVGRTIIGQIHGSEDEPCRLYYRKLPNNPNGAIYFAHEPADGFGDEQWIEIIGSRSNSASNPTDGIALNEKFSYSIKVVGNSLTVTISRDGKPDTFKTINITNSGFANDWMYFKAGVYTQNNSGNATDYDQVTFYAINIMH